MCVAGNCGVSFGGSSIAENTVYINGLNVTDFYNRVGSSSRAVRVLQGVPGQDRRLLGGVRPHDRRRDQCRDPLRHERVRVRHGSRVGAELAAVGQDRPIQPQTARRASSAATTSTTAPTPRPTRPARSSRTGCSSSRCTRRATTTSSTPTRPRRPPSRTATRTMLLGREDRLADHRQASAGAAGVLRRERAVTRQLRLRPSRTAQRGAYQSTRFNDSGGTELGGDLHRLSRPTTSR